MFIAPKFLMYPAPLGAACKTESLRHMALRWSAGLIKIGGYKHCAPLEHFKVRRLR